MNHLRGVHLPFERARINREGVGKDEDPVLGSSRISFVCARRGSLYHVRASCLAPRDRILLIPETR